jgi:hypothetical protein
LYWQLSEPVDAAPGEAQQAVEDALKLACAYVGGDTQAAEAARLLRLPGSHNRKNGDAIPVAILVDSDRRYEISDLVDFWLDAQPIMPEPAKTDGSERETIDRSGPVDVDAEFASIVDGHSTNAAHKRIIPSLLRKAIHPDDVLDQVVDGTMARAVQCGLPWDRGEEVKAVRRRILSGYILLLQDYDPSTGTIPDCLETFTRSG